MNFRRIFFAKMPEPEIESMSLKIRLGETMIIFEFCIFVFEIQILSIAGQFGATFTSKYFPVVMYWNYIWLQNIIPPIHGTQVRSGGFKCGGGVVME